MAYDASKPANDGFIADAPQELRTNFEGIKNDQIVNAGTLNGLKSGNAKGQIPVSNGNVNTGLNAEKHGGNLPSAYATAGHGHSVANGSSDGFMANTDKAKLDTINAGAEVNQNAFSNVVVGGTTIQADSKTDTLEIVAGANIAITPDATNDRVTIAVSGKVGSAGWADGADGATKLITASKINGIAFNGTADITIKADPNTHTHLKANITDFPVIFVTGMIMMWSGSTTAVPGGWALCDGTNGTPNLSGKFVLGAGSGYGTGTTGGEATHTLTSSEMPVHGHGASAAADNQGNHAHSIGGFAQGAGIRHQDSADSIPLRGDVGQYSGVFNLSNAGLHTHNISVSIGNTGGGAAHNNMPPYYVLAYIMKL